MFQLFVNYSLPMIDFIQLTYSWFKNKYLVSTSKFPQSIFIAQIFQLYLWLAIPINLLSHIIGQPMSSSQNCTWLLLGHNHLLISLLSLFFLKMNYSLPKKYIVYTLIPVTLSTISRYWNSVVRYCCPFFIVFYFFYIWLNTCAIYGTLFFFPINFTVIFSKKIVISCVVKICSTWSTKSINLLQFFLYNK